MTTGRSANLDKFVSEATRPARILLLEDHSPTVELMREAVRGLNCYLDVPEAAACSTCERVPHESYDLVLVDLIQPGVDVPKLIEDLNQSAIHASVVVFTRYPGHVDALNAMKAGAMVFVIKPDQIDREWICRMLKTFRIYPLPVEPKPKEQP